LRARAQAGAAVRRRSQPCDSPDQVTVRPQRRRQPPPRRIARNELQTATAFRIAVSGTQLRHPRRLRPVTSTRTLPSPVLTVTVSRESPAGCAAGRCRTARSRAARHQPRTGARAGHPGCERAGTRARSAHPATVTLTWTAASAISAPPSRRPAPGNSRAAGADTGDVRPVQRRTSSRNTPPARPVRGRPWKSRRCAPTVLAPRTPSAIRPWTPQRVDSR
jgi:hypothetical protein